MENFYKRGRDEDAEHEKIYEEIHSCRLALDALIKDDYVLDYRDADEAMQKQKEDLRRVFDKMRDAALTWWD